MAASSLFSSSFLITLYYILISFFFIINMITINGENSDDNETLLILMGRGMEKTSHMHFYFHDTVSGRNPTAIQIAGPGNLTGTGFGTMMIMDDILTEGPELTSKHIGKAQGMYALVGQQEVSLLMNMNLVFMEGKYNGSTLSVLGRNPISHPVREMPITGGSGLFRLARGYALAKTVWFHGNGDAVVEYNVSILHY